MSFLIGLLMIVSMMAAGCAIGFSFGWILSYVLYIPGVVITVIMSMFAIISYPNWLPANIVTLMNAMPICAAIGLFLAFVCAYASSCLAFYLVEEHCY